jgi:predicted RNA binding protein YcfA (HicA-like mRNA interferase family)
VSRLRRCKRLEFISRLKKIGFSGPYSGARHQFMVFQRQRLTVPSNKEYSVPQLRRMLNEAGYILGRRIRAKEWDNL